MPKITDLQRQKHKKERVSVFVDGEYAFSLSDTLVAEYGLKIGSDVNLLPLKEIAENDEKQAALEKAFMHLSAGDKTERQMREFLKKKQFADFAVDHAIDRLKELKYIDDYEYAIRFAGCDRGLGKRAIAYKLKMNGVDEKTIAVALEGIDDEDFYQSAYELAEKQLKRYEKLSYKEQKQKLSAYLARRGYDWDTISSVVDNLIIKAY